MGALGMGNHPEFDLVVVGAGPGGSNAASVALRGGLRVAQVDRQSFPRLKPCAGGITVKALAAVQFDIAPALRHVATSVELNSWNGRRRLYSRRLPLLRMVYRPEFDNYLVEQNCKAPGFAFFDGEAVIEARYNEGTFSVKTNKRTLLCPQLVAADGAYSTLNRQFAVASPKAAAVAIETNIRFSDAHVIGEPIACFDFGVIDQGYGWIFPKDDHWSIGLYTYARGVKDLRDRLSDYACKKGIMVSSEVKLVFDAHLVPVGGYRLRVPRFPLYVVGDAGGFADGLTGEGIYHALESGRLAGQTACRVSRRRQSHREYYRRLWKSVLLDTFLTYQGAKWFYRDTGSHLGVLDHALIWRPMMEGFAQGATFAKSIGRGGQYFVESFISGGVSRRAAIA